MAPLKHMPMSTIHRLVEQTSDILKPDLEGL